MGDIGDVAGEIGDNETPDGPPDEGTERGSLSLAWCLGCRLRPSVC